MNKILVKIYFPVIEEEYNVWLPLNKKIYNIIFLLLKGVNELREEEYKPEETPSLYNKLTGTHYNVNSYLARTDIRNGTELILI